MRPATAYGPRCPQLASSNGAGSENEGCLYLNVFRPPHARRAPIGDAEFAAEPKCAFWSARGG